MVQGGAVVLVPERSVSSMLLSIHLLTVAPVLPLLGRHYDCVKHGRNHRQQPLVLGWWQGWCEQLAIVDCITCAECVELLASSLRLPIQRRRLAIIEPP